MKTILEKSRYLSLIGVISLLIASLTAFGWGTYQTFFATLSVIQTRNADSTITIQFIQIVDSFLIATALFIFSISLYELFIGKLDLPAWMSARNLYELKTKLSSMIVLVMAVKFLSNLIEIKDGTELLQRGIATALVSAVLIAFGYFGKKD